MRLEVTKKCDLAMESLRVLSDSSSRIKGPSLAEKVGSTAGFISQVLTPLVRKGLINSDPGPQGGYSLNKALDQISVLEIIETIEGPTDSGRCVLAEQPCTDASHCALHLAWSRARTHLLNELNSTTVAESFLEESFG